MKGTIYLIPSPLGDTDIDKVIPQGVTGVIASLKHFVVEDIRTARRYLSKAGLKGRIDTLNFYTLNEHTPDSAVEEYIKIAAAGEGMGMISEAGLPAVADPGAKLVELAHKEGIKVVPLSGPSSIFLALMASGMNGQSFAFRGYLPVKSEARREAIREIERLSDQKGQTQIIIETPYRNNALLNDILQVCRKGKLLCIAASVTTDQEFIKTMTIGEWQNHLPELNKKPAIFIL
ncbi:MAG: SAM-dependent methyltransferase [Bacteroidales bacterium]|nr:SAM-dependent methyltransferase [Bacteroidales bacterium]MDD2426323.1 SAM-dependent methyltransferase [Bacteroidales bacterium]MDD3988912.1 SAM-dependent methyltransferase [Bacteroidales bacterium]MDD4638628.1 SAM-dependent methyltransferase [Bacteroidales bacterium]